MSGVQARLLIAGALFVVLAALAALTGDAFAFIVAIALLAGPIINWTAFARLRGLRRLRAARGLPVIRSLRSAYYASLLLAVASTVIAGLAGFTVLRAFPQLGVPPLPRTVYLLFLAYPLLLLTSPAFEWLALVPTTGSLQRFIDWDHREEPVP